MAARTFLWPHVRRSMRIRYFVFLLLVLQVLQVQETFYYSLLVSNRHVVGGQFFLFMSWTHASRDNKGNERMDATAYFV